MLPAKMSYWLRCASSVMTMMSDRVGEHRVAFAVLRAELLDQREDVAVVFLVQHPLQALTAVSPDPLFVFQHCSCVGEVAVDLAVQVVTVGDDHERPVAGNLPQHLLGEEDHRIALAGTLRVPEHAELALVLLDVLDGGDGVVDAEELVVLGDELGRVRPCARRTA